MPSSYVTEGSTDFTILIAGPFTPTGESSSSVTSPITDVPITIALFMKVPTLSGSTVAWNVTVTVSPGSISGSGCNNHIFDHVNVCVPSRLSKMDSGS